MATYKSDARKLENVILNNLVCLNDKLVMEKTNKDKSFHDEINWEVLTANPLLDRIKYFMERRRGIVERIFWLVAFVLSMAASVNLIYGIWHDQAEQPVIVTFQSNKLNIDKIPFPAVTICNMNLFPKSEIQGLIKLRSTNVSSIESIRLQNWINYRLNFVKSFCNGHQSFAKSFNYAYKRGRLDNLSLGPGQTRDREASALQIKFLTNFTQPCKEFIKLCKLEGRRIDCSEIFKPVFTDHGICCTFNILPLSLLLRESLESPVIGIGWSPGEINSWKMWNYEKGFVLNDRRMKWPWRQTRSGLPFGLSILVDANPDNYYCPTADAKGIRYILHSPLEQPHVMELSSIAGIGKEVLVEIHPDMTTADERIIDVDKDKRSCFFGWERKLQLYQPYTYGNCVEECVARSIGLRCGCSQLHLPGFDNLTLCGNDPVTEEAQCILQNKVDLQATLEETCGCLPLCEDILYNHETTSADLQDARELWLDSNPEYDYIPKWANHKPSIMHFFYGSESTIPKERKLRQSQTDLIAATGGILGLCIGFSVLSFVEIAYFIVFRALSKCTKRSFRRMKRKLKQNKDRRSISVNPSHIPVYPAQFQFSGLYN